MTSDLSGKKVLITSGSTAEAIDPVRVITNRSSGKMGQALKLAAQNAQAEVVFVEATNIDQLKKDIAENFNKIDILIMAAAVSDYKPVEVSAQKIKSSQDKLLIEFEKTEDLLAYFGTKKTNQYLVGFALESEHLIENATNKLTDKNLDLIIANDTSAIGADKSSIKIIDKNNQIEEYNNLDKIILAEKIIARICRDIS
ncbi:phosphopantothenoylcysteine decarboxylase [bacterium]|nr:phosphopantothenoylcysteine decarboxylase [bacterium]